MKRRVGYYVWLAAVWLVLFVGLLPVYYVFGPGWVLLAYVVAMVIPPFAAVLGTIGTPAGRRG